MADLQDIHFMKSALNMARRGLGRVAPNPVVGCVIVKDGIVLARARTADGGRPHAETQALKQAGEEAQGATVYVSLEPCAHHGKTGPCAEGLIEAGVVRVVIACVDPDPRTSGQGIAKLKAAGIEVQLGICEDEAKALNAGFFLTLSDKRPFITLKTATSADEKVGGGKDRWVTGELSRVRAHLMRSRYDAILVGIGTVLADGPLLTTRVPGLEHNITRVVVDRDLKIPRKSKLLQSASQTNPVIVFHGSGEDHVQEGVTYMKATEVKQIVRELAELGITRLLVEGGPRMHGAFIEAGLYDEIAWFKAPHEIGESGIPALENASFGDICKDMILSEAYQCGNDILEIYQRNQE